MSGLATTELGKPARTPVWVWWLLGLVAAAFLAANAHLIYVATMSQPACVEHLHHGAPENGRFAAAQSSCSPLSAKRSDPN
jgi:hypothetical protein